MKIFLLVAVIGIVGCKSAPKPAPPLPVSTPEVQFGGTVEEYCGNSHIPCPTPAPPAKPKRRPTLNDSGIPCEDYRLPKGWVCDEKREILSCAPGWRPNGINHCVEVKSGVHAARCGIEVDCGTVNGLEAAGIEVNGVHPPKFIFSGPLSPFTYTWSVQIPREGLHPHECLKIGDDEGGTSTMTEIPCSAEVAP